MSDGLLWDLPDTANVEDDALDHLTACTCGRPRTLTADDLLICPACDLPPGSVLAALWPRPVRGCPGDVLAVPA